MRHVSISKGVYGHVTLADIVVYQFLHFTKDCYGVDMTAGSGETVKDVYGRDVKEKYLKLAEFYEAFSTRDTARKRDELGEEAPEKTLAMRTWADGVL